MGNPNTPVLTEDPEHGDPEVYEPRYTWEQVYYADSLDADLDLKAAHRRQEYFDEDPETFHADAMLRAGEWIGDCREMG